MRTLDAGFAAHIAAGVTTLCRCWKLTRSDGTVMGFTDHDRDVTFGGVTYEPETGFDASEDTSSAGFAIGTLEVLGALSSDRLSADDLAAGVYDSAAVEVYLVNWTTPSERQLIRTGTIGEVTREDGAFRAEIRGLAAALDQPNGRVFRYACDADLGDARCGIDLTGATYRGAGTVVSSAGKRRFSASGLDTYDGGWFDRGRLVWTGGENAGRAIEVQAHRNARGAVTFDLWQSMHFEIAAGDTFTVTAGCDKLPGTCQAKFDNFINFRGFPAMPGDDFSFSYARPGDRNDGTPVA